MIPAWALALGVGGAVLVVAGASKKQKPSWERPHVAPQPPEPSPPFHDPNALPEPAPMASDAFKAELAERVGNLAWTARQGGPSAVSPEGISYLLGLRWFSGLDGSGPFREQVDLETAEAAFLAGASAWDAYAGIFDDEQRSKMWAFAKAGHAAMTGNQKPAWYVQLKALGFNKRAVARYILGESNATAALFG